MINAGESFHDLLRVHRDFYGSLDVLRVNSTVNIDISGLLILYKLDADINVWVTFAPQRNLSRAQLINPFDLRSLWLLIVKM